VGDPRRKDAAHEGLDPALGGATDVTPLAQDWILFLKGADGAAGFPLVAAGLGLMLFGWRTWRICVMLAYMVIGSLIGAFLFGPRDDLLFYALSAGAVLGLASYWLVNYFAAALGGIIGAGIIMHLLGGVGISDTALWTAGGAAFIGCTAFAFLNRSHLVILVTAFLGAILLVSGLTVWIMGMPRLYGTLNGMAAGSAVVIPFLLLVPTVMSCFYQVADARRIKVDV
jgi:hypothetical protein